MSKLKMYFFQVPFGVAVGGLTYLSLQGLCNVPGVGPCLQVLKVYLGLLLWAPREKP